MTSANGVDIGIESSEVADELGVILSQLRHLYQNMTTSRFDSAQVRRENALATGLLSPQIEKLERLQRALTLT